MGLPSSVDVVPPTFFGKISGIFEGVYNSFPFLASDFSIWGTSASCEGISPSFIFPFVFALSYTFVSNPGGGPSFSGGGVVDSPYKLFGKQLLL
jgi:hypothetical protein